MRAEVPKARPHVIPATLILGLVSLFLVVGDEPAASETYYQAPDGPGKWTIRNDLFMPSMNNPADVSQKELINYGLPPGSHQKYLGVAHAYSYVCGFQNSPEYVGQCGATIAELILVFQHAKVGPNLRILFETPNPLFHLLSVSGGPIWIGNNAPTGKPYITYPEYYLNGFVPVSNSGHWSENNLSMRFLLPWPNSIVNNQSMPVLIDNTTGNGIRGVGPNRMWIYSE